MSSIALTTPFASAAAFLDALRPGSPLLGQDDWIFRGHPRATYKLIPSAARSSGEFKKRYFSDQSSVQAQISGEFRALREFFTIADRHGVLPPDLSHQLHGIFDPWRMPPIYEEIQAGHKSWLPDELLYLAAIAQHYGVPTRLLDWTQHPLIAAYFAAKENVGTGRRRSRLAVWAFNVSVYSFEDSMARLENASGKATDFPLRVIGVSSAGNANIHAQRGMFTLFRPKESRPAFLLRPLDVLLASATQVSGRDRLRSVPWVMHRLTLPTREAVKLMQLLAIEDVTAARLFPGLGGVVTSMHESLLSGIRIINS